MWNIFLLLFLNLLVKPFWIFGIDRSVQNVLGASEYGLYFTLFNFTIILNMILDMGITNFNNREIAMNEHVLGKYLSNIFGIRLLLGLVYFAVALGLAYFLGYRTQEYGLLLILLLNQFLAAFILYFRSNISALHKFKTDSIISVLDRLILILIASVLIWGNIGWFHISIKNFVLAQTLSYLITFVVSLAVVVYHSGYLKIRFDWVFLLSILKKSYPYALLSVLMALYYRVDSIMLERMLPNGREMAGIYAQAFRIIDALAMVGYLFSTILLPMFSKMIQQRQNLLEVIRPAFSLLFFISMGVSIFGCFYGLNIMDVLYRAHIHESAEVFTILVFGFIPISISYIFGTLLTAKGEVKRLNQFAVFSVFLNVVLNLILIPRFQAVGSATASVLTQGLMLVFQLTWVGRLFGFGLVNRKTINYAVYTVISVLAAWFLHAYTSELLKASVLFIVISLASAIALKLVTLKSVFQLFKIEEE